MTGRSSIARERVWAAWERYLVDSDPEPFLECLRNDPPPEWREQLRAAWEQYLLDGLAAPLMTCLLASEPAASRCECPDRLRSLPFMDGPSFCFLHRICDVELNGQAYRVCRCVACGETLTFSPLGRAATEPGVPYALTGEKLRRWARDAYARHAEWRSQCDARSRLVQEAIRRGELIDPPFPDYPDSLDPSLYL
jgi:hypothetical protein